MKCFESVVSSSSVWVCLLLFASSAFSGVITFEQLGEGIMSGTYSEAGFDCMASGGVIQNLNRTGTGTIEGRPRTGGNWLTITASDGGTFRFIEVVAGGFEELVEGERFFWYGFNNGEVVAGEGSYELSDGSFSTVGSLAPFVHVDRLELAMGYMVPGDHIVFDSITLEPVPEPAAGSLFAVGILVLAWRRRARP